jgi:hypothetical protein
LTGPVHAPASIYERIGEMKNQSERQNDEYRNMTWEEIRKLQEETPDGTMIHIEVDEDAGKDE